MDKKVTLCWSKSASISFEFRVTLTRANADTCFKGENKLFEAMKREMKAMCENARLNGLSMSCSNNETLVIHGSMTANNTEISKIVELLSSDVFKLLLSRILDIPQSTKIDFSFCKCREDGNENNSDNVINGNEMNDDTEADSGIESKNGLNGTNGANGVSSMSSGGDIKYDEIESLMDEWHAYVNGGKYTGNVYIDAIMNRAMKLIDSPQTRYEFLESLLNEHIGLIDGTYQLTSNDEIEFEKIVLLLNRMILYGGNQIFKIFEVNKFDEILMNGMMEHSENEFIVKSCLNAMDILINESLKVWKKFVNDQYNIGTFLARLVQYGDIELRKQECLIIAIINLINGTFAKSTKLRYRDLRIIFNNFVENYLDNIILIVNKVACHNVSIPFCTLMRFVLRVPKVNMSKFEFDLLFNKDYDLFQMLMEMIVLQINKNDFYGMDQVMQILIMLLTNTENEDRLKEKLFNQEQFLNFELLLVDYLHQWETYYKKENKDFEHMLGYMIEFIYVYFGNNKIFNNNILSLDYLNHVIPLASLRMEALAAGMECERKIYVWKVDFISPSDGSHSYAVNAHRARNSLLFPPISNDNEKSHVTSTMKTFGIRNRLFGIFGKYFVDTRHLYSFSQNDQSIYKFENEFHKTVKITLRYVASLDINETIGNYFNYCFFYPNVDIDGVNGISHQFLRQVKYFRDAIKDEAALLDKVVGNNLICWAQSNRLNDQFEMPGGRRVKENNELLKGIFGFLNGNDLIVVNQICTKWYHLTHKLINCFKNWFIKLWNGEKWENRIVKVDCNLMRRVFCQAFDLKIVNFVDLRLDVMHVAWYDFVENIDNKIGSIINEYKDYLDSSYKKSLDDSRQFAINFFGNFWHLLNKYFKCNNLEFCLKFLNYVKYDINNIDNKLSKLNKLHKNERLWPTNDTLECFGCELNKALLQSLAVPLNDEIIRMKKAIKWQKKSKKVKK